MSTPGSTDAKSSSSSIPSTMSAIQVTAYGDPSNTFAFNSSVPTSSIINSNDVLIRVHSASINPSDYKTARGSLTLVHNMTFPYTPGFDVAGEVIAVGNEVKNVKVGDRVYGDIYPVGKTMANYCIGKDYQLAKVPSSISYSQAASIPLVTLTSYQGLFIHGNFQSGQRLLVIGGSSATGQAAIQCAKAVGGFVAATTSTRNIDIVRGIGADLVIDYTKDKWEQILKDQEKFDIVYDTVGELNAFERGSSLLKKDGLFLQIALSGGNQKLTIGLMMGVGLMSVRRKISSWFGSPRYQFFVTDTSETSNAGKQLETVNNWINARKYRPVIDKVFPFTKEGAIDLFHASESGKAKGKLVIEIIPPTTPTPTLSTSSPSTA